uniref:Uncharacterized protein n=2 Tax=Zea mays TaxID=4577 RepID=A0A804N7X2_MAIZE
PQKKTKKPESTQKIHINRTYHVYQRIERPSFHPSHSQSLTQREIPQPGGKALIAPSPSLASFTIPPSFATASSMGKLCCSQEDDEPAFNLLGLLVTVVLALLLLMLCTPPRRRRCVAYYPRYC